MSQRLNRYRLADFSSGYSPREKVRLALWRVLSRTAFEPWFVPVSARVALLRAFGATVSDGVVVRSGVRIHAPWFLKIGAHSWLGEEVRIVNHAQVVIGADVCLSQQVFVCSSGHDPYDANFSYAHRPVRIEDNVWLTLRATVLPGTTVARGSTIYPGAVLRPELPRHA